MARFEQVKPTSRLSEIVLINGVTTTVKLARVRLPTHSMFARPMSREPKDSV
jgi:hypothetical protein